MNGTIVGLFYAGRVPFNVPADARALGFPNGPQIHDEGLFAPLSFSLSRKDRMKQASISLEEQEEKGRGTPGSSMRCVHGNIKQEHDLSTSSWGSTDRGLVRFRGLIRRPITFDPTGIKRVVVTYRPR
jgi:hypothetical protein